MRTNVTCMGFVVLLLSGIGSVVGADPPNEPATDSLRMGVPGRGGNPSFVPNELIVLLDHGPIVPTPEDVVEAVAQRRPVPADLGIGNPVAARFVISERASEAARAYLSENSEGPEALLQRYVVLTYPPAVNVDAVAFALEINPNVLWVGKNTLAQVSVTEPNDPLFDDNPGGGPPRPPEQHQWGSYSLHLHEAWDYTKGHAYVGIVDLGIDTDHPDLRPFDGSGNFIGGNFRAHLSRDYGYDDGNVDEGQAQGSQTVSFAGHGTHVAGIVGATPNNSVGVAGACWNCSLLISKVSRISSGGGATTAKADVAEGIEGAINHGAQVLNLSLGYRPDAYPDCAADPLDPLCTALQLLENRDAVMAAAAGNDASSANDWPAVDSRVIGVGGIAPGGAFWNDCPGFECGSNSDLNQLVTPAKQVLSTFYEGLPYNPSIGCSDSTDGTLDGFGPCSGTSMSSPYLAGSAGILRSINPLLTKANIRSLFTSNLENPPGWNTANGLGKPNVHLAVQAALGRAGGQVLTNRLTPLFSMYSFQAEDHFYTTFPQMGAAAYWSAGGINGYWREAGYSSSGPDVAGYGYFPGAGCVVSPCQPEPGASVYVFSTDRSPNGMLLVPLYRLSFNGPNPNNPGNVYNRDTTYTTEAAGIVAFSGVGYKLDGVEGYIYKKCTPEPSCIPAGTVRLFRRYNPQRDDFAIFPESELAFMESQGYTLTGGPSFSEVLGYAYPNVDSDGDRVIDGFEAVLGTDPLTADTDCDGLGDGIEILDYPHSDPRGSACARNADFVTQTVPSTMVAGQSYVVSVTLKNVGTITWSPIGPGCGAFRLGSANPYNNTIWGSAPRVDLPEPIAPGQMMTLSFTVTAPASPGTHNFQWQMVQECVQWFGDFTANLAIPVRAAQTTDAQILGQVVPETMIAGQTYPVSVTVKNVGVGTWTPVGPGCGAFRLGSANPYDNTTWGPATRVELPGPIAPGQAVTLSFTVTAPATPGTYNFQWRMVQECAQWFGDFTTNLAIPVRAAQTTEAQVVGQSVPAAMVAGQSYSVSVTVKNLGVGTWTPVGPGCGAFRLGSANPYDNTTWGPATRVELPGPIAPGQAVTLSFTITAPATPGTYNFQWRMVQECAQWFGDFTTNLAIPVRAAHTTDAQMLGQSVPTGMTAGQSYTVSVTVKNVGVGTWTPVGPGCGAFRLGSANPYDNTTWGPATRVELPGPIAPGQAVTLSFTVTAPATPGIYNFQRRMVQECAQWFGDFTPNVLVAVVQ